MTMIKIIAQQFLWHQYNAVGVFTGASSNIQTCFSRRCWLS